MITLPRQVEYAIIALADMHAGNPGQLFAVRGICEQHAIPFDVMSKTMQRLTRAKILRSIQGVNGGYQIIRDLSTVCLLELMEAVVGKVGVVICLKEGKVCPLEENCNVVSGMSVLDHRIKDVYKSTTILELIVSTDPVRAR